MIEGNGLLTNRTTTIKEEVEALAVMTGIKNPELYQSGFNPYKTHYLNLDKESKIRAHRVESCSIRTVEGDKRIIFFDTPDMCAAALREYKNWLNHQVIELEPIIPDHEYITMDDDDNLFYTKKNGESHQLIVSEVFLYSVGYSGLLKQLKGKYGE